MDQTKLRWEVPIVIPSYEPDEKLPGLYRCRLDQGAHGGIVQEVSLKDGEYSACWRPVRPLPEVDYFFENQWKAYRDREMI